MQWSQDGVNVLRVVIIVQARMGSTRLPGKVLEQVLDKPLLFYLIERLRRCRTADALVVATTTNPLDQQIVDFCKKNKVSYYRGSEEDVLDRYWHAAQEQGADIIVRICSDCPLTDPAIVDQVVALYSDQHPAYDYVSNTLTRSYPRGMDVEVFSFESLEAALQYTSLKSEREHVTPYIYRHPDRFKLGSITRQPDSSRYRLTVDTPEDLTLITKLIEAHYPKNPHFGLAELLASLEENPQWAEINAAVEQKTV